ncbi:uncharacterized protein [Aphelocoma coerulescens]|uniref:uncharacterized protein isoform X1 n=1 Tax=Aphelocoma coerulescens TaxID=39617 RepID=UPI0036054678
MRDQIDLLAMVTVLGVLEQAYFAVQVIYARRKYKISPPETTGHPDFERTFRAQSHCTVRVSTRGALLRAVSFCSVPMERAMLEGKLLRVLPNLHFTPLGCWNLLPSRCDCGVWAVVPLHPPQVLPGIHRGCTGTVGTTVRHCLAALAAAGSGTGRAPGTLPVAQLLLMDVSTGLASPATQCLVRGATALPKITVCPWHRGASHVAPSERDYFPVSVLPSEGRWMLALLCSSEIISLLESKCFPASAPAEELHC